MKKNDLPYGIINAPIFSKDLFEPGYPVKISKRSSADIETVTYGIVINYSPNELTITRYDGGTSSIRDIIHISVVLSGDVVIKPVDL